MESFDDIYMITRAQKKDISDIMCFINEYWKKNHIIATNRELFEYEFLDNDNVNFIIARGSKTLEIEGVFGFLYTAQNIEKRDIWGSIWKVKDGNKALLGLELLKRMVILSGCRYNLDVGANPKTSVPVVRTLLKYQTDKMNHYYILSDFYKDNYKIAYVNDYCYKKVEHIEAQDYLVEELTELMQVRQFFEDNKAELLGAVPYKDFWLVEKKYINHPINEYHIYGIKAENSTKGLMILRIQEKDDRKAIRFVDYLGDERFLQGTSSFWHNILIKYEAEYVDFYEHGFDQEILTKAGFKYRDESDTNIIPNYFYPFVQENIDIWTYSSTKQYKACKADGDQDRPN